MKGLKTMKKLLAVLLAGVALVACSNNESSSSANASATEASAPAAAPEASAPAAAPEASAPAASAPEASAAK